MNDGYEKNPALDASAVFKTQNRIMVPEPFTVEQRYERALHDAVKKAPCHRRYRPKRTDATGKNLESEATPAAGAGQNNVARILPMHSTKNKP